MQNEILDLQSKLRSQQDVFSTQKQKFVIRNQELEKILVEYQEDHNK